MWARYPGINSTEGGRPGEGQVSTGFRVQDLEFRSWGAGLRVKGRGFRGSGIRVQGSGFRVQGLGLRVSSRFLIWSNLGLEARTAFYLFLRILVYLAVYDSR